MRLGLHWDGISNAEYHALHPNPVEHHYSSSQLKKLLEDPEKFFRLYISREEKDEKESRDYFDIGSYFHTALLEPHLLKEEYAIYKGTRSGKMWEAFKEKHPGKTILTANDHEKAMNCVNGVRKSKFSLDLIEHPEARYEVSVFHIFHGVRVKVRFDILTLQPKGSGLISYAGDLKSMDGSCRDKHKLKNSLSERNYRLSAALYVDVVNDWVEKVKAPFNPVEYWYWIFASKKESNSQTVQATERDLAIGRAQYMQAIETIKENKLTGWTFEDGPITLAPAQWEVDKWEKTS